MNNDEYDSWRFSVTAHHIISLPCVSSWHCGCRVWKSVQKLLHTNFNTKWIISLWFHADWWFHFPMLDFGKFETARCYTIGGRVNAILDQWRWCPIGFPLVSHWEILWVWGSLKHKMIALGLLGLLLCRLSDALHSYQAPSNLAESGDENSRKWTMWQAFCILLGILPGCQDVFRMNYNLAKDTTTRRDFDIFDSTSSTASELITVDTMTETTEIRTAKVTEYKARFPHPADFLTYLHTHPFIAIIPCHNVHPCPTVLQVT